MEIIAQIAQQNAAGATIRLCEALKLEALREVEVVAGRRGLDRCIRWVHIVDIPEITPWLHGGELLLTTGYGWSRNPRVQRKTVRALNDLSLAGILFETGKFIRKVPLTVRREAERLDLPILQAPYKVKFVDITEAIHRAILERQYAHLSHLGHIHQTLTRATLEADDLQGIADVLSGLIDKPVAIMDAEFRVLAYASVSDQLDQARTETIQGGNTPAHVLQNLDDREIRRRLHEAQGPLRISDAGMEARIVCPIRTAQDLLGYVCILEGAHPLSDLDVRAAEHTATLAALHILKQQAVASVENRVHYTFVDALIRGEFERSAGIRERARLLGFDPEGDYAVAVLTIAPSAKRGRRRALSGRSDFELRECYGRALRTALEGLGLVQFVTFLLNQIVFLLPAAGGWTRVKLHLERLWQALHGQDSDIPLILTVGEIHRGAEGVARSYWEADTLVEVVPMNGVFLYHEHALAQLLLRVDPAVLKKLHRDTLDQLGDRHALRTTLLTLLSTGFKIRAAAEALGVHRNTVRQRLMRMRQGREVSLQDPKFWAQLILITEAEKYGLLQER